MATDASRRQERVMLYSWAVELKGNNIDGWEEVDRTEGPKQDRKQGVRLLRLHEANTPAYCLLRLRRVRASDVVWVVVRGDGEEVARTKTKVEAMAKYKALGGARVAKGLKVEPKRIS